MASVVAAALRVYWLGAGPLFPVQLHSSTPVGLALLVACPLGMLVGLASAFLSRLMYGLEDGFEHVCGRLKVHWMWWPAIGGIGVGLGGFFFPRVGCWIRQHFRIAARKCSSIPVAWTIGSQVAHVGIFAEFRNIGRRIGAPVDDWRGIGRISCTTGAYARRNAALWALMGMGAMLSGALGVPLTAILFSLELTHAMPALLPLTLHALLRTWLHRWSCLDPFSLRT